MSLAFTAFFVQLRDGPIDVLLSHIRAGQETLRKTTPSSRYVVLTDRRTAPLLQGHVEVAITAPDHGALMERYTKAQLTFVEESKDKIIVLAATDCLANRDLNQSIPKNHGFAITYKKGGEINNIGYVRNRETAARFLRRAIDILASYPPERQHWFGDQQAWQDALGPERRVVDEEQKIFAAGDCDSPIYLYPCSSHNCFPKLNGELKSSMQDAFLLHCKGPRKEAIQQVAAQIISGFPYGPVRV